MKKILMICIICMLCFSVAGCGKNYIEMVESHAAFKSYNNEEWKIRYFSSFINEVGTKEKDIVVYLSVDVKENMSKKEMEKILDYYKFTRTAKVENETYKGSVDAEYMCYAVFYQGEDDEELWKVKWNGKECEVTEEDEKLFPNAEMRSTEEELEGEWP